MKNEHSSVLSDAGKLVSDDTYSLLARLPCVAHPKHGSYVLNAISTMFSKPSLTTPLLIKPLAEKRFGIDAAKRKIRLRVFVVFLMVFSVYFRFEVCDGAWFWWLRLFCFLCV